jgi:dTDP-4-dehydrorhamnose reductase
MLQLAKSRDEVAIVADQRGNPTSALDIAGGILRIAEDLTRDSDPARRGIFHMTASGEASWAELAEAVFAASAECGGPTARVRYITTADYPTPAPRPADSRLDSSRLTRTYGVRLPDWRRSTEDVVGRLIRSAL